MSEEHDWVRDHLSALGSPAMPEDVARRLDAAIAAAADRAEPHLVPATRRRGQPLGAVVTRRVSRRPTG